MLPDGDAAVAAESVGNLDACGYGSVVDLPGVGEIEASACQVDDATVASPTPASAADRRRPDRLRAPAETLGSDPDQRRHPLAPGSAAGDEDVGDEGAGDEGAGDEDAGVGGVGACGRTYGALREGAEVLAAGSECGLVPSGPGLGEAGAGGCCEG